MSLGYNSHEICNSIMFIRVLPIKYIIVSCLAKLTIFLKNDHVHQIQKNPLFAAKPRFRELWGKEKKEEEEEERR